MALYRVDNPVLLASGESAEYSYWITSGNFTDVQAYVGAYQSHLAADAGFIAIFPTSVTFGTPKISTVDIATGAVISTSFHGSAFAGFGSGAAGSVVPPQCAICVTLRTAFAGRSDTGRYYLPGPIASKLDVRGRLNTAIVNSLSASLIAATNAAILAGPSCAPVVYSRKLRATNAITELDVGDVVDTQRRRRDALVEVRAGGPI